MDHQIKMDKNVSMAKHPVKDKKKKPQMQQKRKKKV